MATSVQNVIDAVIELIQDEDQGVFTDAKAYKWINDAMRIVCWLRPDACTETEAVGLSVNTSRQTLGTDKRRLMQLTRNMGAGGITIGKAIRGPISRELMDSFNPDWQTVTGSYVKEYIYNPDDPKVFWVYPHLTSTWYVEGIFIKNPTEVTAVDDNLSTDDIYTPQIITWVAYRYFSRDSEESPTHAKGQVLLNEFLTFFGLKSKSDIKTIPQLVEFDKNVPN